MFLRSLVGVLLASWVSAHNVIGRPGGLVIDNSKRALLQDVVTFDNSSLFIRGERIVFYSGEFHPFRLPVPGLWLDVFQKIKALGYNGVSFYTDWALLEGKPGHFSAEGIFDLQPFFHAASSAGIYLLARPGPYINAEVSGGGFPGWLARSSGIPRTRDPIYLMATDNYVRSVGEIIAKAQITNGGPVILLQPENEYTRAESSVPFPDPVYFEHVKQQYRDAGIIVPLISNGAGTVDISGNDIYPLGFNCSNPGHWPGNALTHGEKTTSTPYSLVEYQGGSFDPWGGSGFEKCAALVNEQFERVFYTNVLSFGATIFNIYMTYGGSNWGNLGYPGGYSSYDYGAPIAEDRTLNREKYSEAKLLANFVRASPAYITAIPQTNTKGNGSFTGDDSISVSQSHGNPTGFYFVRHADYTSLNTTDYSITIPTSQGTIKIPQLRGSLSLRGRDSNIHVADYDAGGTRLLYSSANIFTCKRYLSKTILIVYGGAGQTHELALQTTAAATFLEGEGAQVVSRNGTVIVNFVSTPSRQVIQLGNTVIYLLDRKAAYNLWMIDVPADRNADQNIDRAVIINGGYLMRTAIIDGTIMRLTGDINATTVIEIIGGAPAALTAFCFNGKYVRFEQSDSGVVTATIVYKSPMTLIPDLDAIGWKTIDSLPEILTDYNDSLWPDASLSHSNNTARNLTTPTTLYGFDYGFNAGNLVYRGHFIALGNETELLITTQGGTAYGASIWLGSNFMTSFYGHNAAASSELSIALPKLNFNKEYVITVLVDNMGLDENRLIGSSQFKNPRGILDYELVGRSKETITWKLTGNLGGEDFHDASRGPLNEGGLYVERQGWHLPGAPTQDWADSSGPTKGIDKAGVQFYSTTFELHVPDGYDVPLLLRFGNGTDKDNLGLSSAYRCQIYVNGLQYGKFIHNIGPQVDFPIPQGIWNYQGSNYLGITLWALEGRGAKVASLALVAGHAVQTGYGPVEKSPLTEWTKRSGAY